jgi:hypothetical protein
MGEYLAHGKVAVVTRSTRRIRPFGLYFEDPLGRCHEVQLAEAESGRVAAGLSRS